jgi:hypothetical protein
MSFRFLIIDRYAGDVQGTDDPETAKEFADCLEFVVVDCETCSWIGTDGKDWPIEEAILSREEDEDDN